MSELPRLPVGTGLSEFSIDCDLEQPDQNSKHKAASFAKKTKSKVKPVIVEICDDSAPTSKTKP